MVVQVRGVSTTEEREEREDDGVGLPRRALRAVGVPRGVLCNKRADYDPNSNIVIVIPQQIHETRDTVTQLLSVDLMLCKLQKLSKSRLFHD